MTKLFHHAMNIINFCQRASLAVLLITFTAAVPASAQITGTGGDDVFVVNETTQTVRINGVLMNYDASQSAVRIEGLGGNDVLAYLSGTGTTRCVFNTDQVVFETPGIPRFLVTGFELLRFQGSGSDTAEFNGRSSRDTFRSRVGFSGMISGRWTFEAYGEIDVIARARGGIDFASITGSSGDDFVDVLATSREAVVERVDATVRTVGFASVEVNATQGGTDLATIEDSTLSDMLSMEAQDTIFVTPNMSVELNGFEDVDCISVNGGTDMVEFRDIDSPFDYQTGDTSDPDPSLFVSAETFSRFVGSNYNNVATNFAFTDYFPNYADSRMRIVDSPGDDYIADPREDHAQQTTLERRGIMILRETRSSVARTIPATLLYTANRGGFDVVDSFNLSSGTQFSRPLVRIEENAISSFGVTRFVGGVMDPDFFQPKTCFIAKDAEVLNFHASDLCRVTVVDSPGNDSVVIESDSVTVRYPNRTIEPTGRLEQINAGSVNGGVDDIIFRSSGEDVRVSAITNGISLTRFPLNSAVGFDTARVVVGGGDLFYDDSTSFDTINAFAGIVEVESPDMSVEIFGARSFTSGGANGGSNTATIADSSTTIFTLPPVNWDVD